MNHLGEPLLENTQIIIEVNDNKSNDAKEFKNSLALILQQRLDERLENKSISSDYLKIVSENWSKNDIQFINTEFVQEYINLNRRSGIMCFLSFGGFIAGFTVCLIGVNKVNVGEGEDQYLKFLISGGVVAFLSLVSWLSPFCRARSMNLPNNSIIVADKFLNELYDNPPEKRKKTMMMSVFNERKTMHMDVINLIGDYICTSPGLSK